MIPPVDILVPIDFSETAESALDYAVMLAAKFGSTVHVLHVFGVPALAVPELGLVLSSTVIDSLRGDAQAALERSVAKRNGQATFGEVMLRMGDPRDVILHAAKDVAADLIVIGTHGRRGLSRALLGSVAEAIVRAAPCPVLTVRAKAMTP